MEELREYNGKRKGIMTREINPQRELVTRIRNKQSRDNEKIEREKKKRRC